MISFSEVRSQSDSALNNAEKISYDLFSKGKWNELISFSENALKKNIDFIFLRVRLGIAYYETEKYFDAIVHLKKAFDLGYETPSAIEYLYYSYLQAGRQEDADFYFYRLPKNKRDRIKPQDNSFMNKFYADGGFGFSNDKSKNENTDIDGSDNIYGEQLINKNYFFISLGFKQLPLRWLNLTYNYNYLDLKKAKVIKYNDVSITDDYKQQQQQFYLKFDIRAGDGFVISPSGHYVFVKDKTIYADYDSATFSYNAQTMSYDSLKYYYSILQRENIQDDYVISLSLSKQFYIYKTALHGSYSFLNGSNQTQLGANMTFYPKKKNTLYTFSDITLHSQNDVTNLIFFQSAGGKLYKDLWGEVFAAFGRMNNYNEQNGALVFNNPDVTVFKFGAEFNYYFSKNISASLVYVNQQREKKYLTYSLSGFSNNLPVTYPELVDLKYSVNTILGGFKIYF